jgi:hypothetical protein
MTNTITCCRILLVAFGLLCVVFTAQADEPKPPAELTIGIATVDITPPIGYRMCGYFFERPSTGTHDPLLARRSSCGKAKLPMRSSSAT